MKIKVSQSPKLVSLMRDNAAISRYLKDVVNDAKKVFVDSSLASGGGRSYKRNGRVHVASLPGAFPAKYTGNLIKGTETKYTAMSVTLGTNITYAIYLNDGTAKMAARQMYKDALNISVSYTKRSCEFVKYGGK